MIPLRMRHPDGPEMIRLESGHLRMDVVPRIGGRVVNLYSKHFDQEFLWRNEALKLAPAAPGDPYNPHFYGGIDELIPNDIPEVVAGTKRPDHGELWTTPLEALIEGESLSLSGALPSSGLYYHRRMALDEASAQVHLAYHIANPTDRPIDFMWKLHAAVKIAPGDRLECPAATAQVVNPSWSRFAQAEPFAWPDVAGQDASLVPPPNGSGDFFYLYDLKDGWMRMIDAARTREFTVIFDPKVLPYAWYFASFGRFGGHYTAVLEPCTTMPISMVEAAARGTCSHLEPGQEMRTHMVIYAGRLRRRVHDIGY